MAYRPAGNRQLRIVLLELYMYTVLKIILPLNAVRIWLLIFPKHQDKDRFLF